MIAGLTLPALTVADPPVAGEGSLDPLGTGALADRIADQLVADVRARMSRIRFLTAMAVASIVTDEVSEVLVLDGRATPSLAFEWLLLEGFVRKNVALPTGVPGTTKARGVLSRKGRLGASTYLKAPGVFGFNGVYKPLATGIRLVTNELLPDERARELVVTWEREQGLAGFVDANDSSDGARLRRRLVDAVRSAVEAAACKDVHRSVWNELPRRLVPDAPGRTEARLLRSWLVDHPIRGELAGLIDGLEPGGDDDLLRAVRDAASGELRMRIDAALAYEELTSHLAVAFNALCWRSTHLGLSPLTPSVAAELDALSEAARLLPDLYSAAADALAAFDLQVDLEVRLGVFADRCSAPELADRLLTHHRANQAAKAPRGKRPWFEPTGDGYVVRSPYAIYDRPERRPFVHPMRVSSLHQFLRDTTP